MRLSILCVHWTNSYAVCIVGNTLLVSLLEILFSKKCTIPRCWEYKFSIHVLGDWLLVAHAVLSFENCPHLALATFIPMMDSHWGGGSEPRPLASKRDDCSMQFILQSSPGDWAEARWPKVWFPWDYPSVSTVTRKSTSNIMFSIILDV